MTVALPAMQRLMAAALPALQHLMARPRSNGQVKNGQAGCSYACRTAAVIINQTNSNCTFASRSQNRIQSKLHGAIGSGFIPSTLMFRLAGSVTGDVSLSWKRWLKRVLDHRCSQRGPHRLASRRLRCCFEAWTPHPVPELPCLSR